MLHPERLDVAHLLPWSEYPDHRADPSNVFALSKAHHAAFDRNLFTIECDYCLRVNPAFETENTLLQRTVMDRAGEYQPVIGDQLAKQYSTEHNASLAWV